MTYPVHLPTHNCFCRTFDNEVTIDNRHEDEDAEESVLIHDNVGALKLSLRNGDKACKSIVR